MSDDAMTTEQAADWLTHRAQPVTGMTAQPIEVVLNRLAELEAGEVTTEWAVRWTADDGGGYEFEENLNRDTAALVARRQYGQLVSREIRTGPWTEAAQ